MNTYKVRWGLAILVLCFVGSLLVGTAAVGAQSPASDVLARIDVTGMLNDIDLPVYAHLQGADGVEYALVIASTAELQASGQPFTVLHQPTAPAGERRYLIALERIEGARLQAAGLVDVLLDDGRRIITWSTSDQAEALVQLGFEIAWLPDSPMVLTAPVATLLELITDYDANVAAMIASVTSDKVNTYCGNLSGENTVEIGGVNYELYTRYTYNSTWIERSTQYVYEFMEDLGLSVSYHAWSGALRNVIGEKAGTTSPDEIILITAHLDDVPSSGRAPGADDNASGSVGVMLAAEILKDYDFERTVRFVFFTGEEQGLLGSKAYSNKVYGDGENIVAVFNMDMIAWDDVGDPVLRLHTRTSSNPGYPADKAIADLFIDVVNLYGLDGELSPVLDPDGISASDHASFWSNGYAAILAIEDDQNDFNDYYHTVNDTLDKLNLPYFTHYVKASVGTAAHLAKPLVDGINASFTYAASK